MTIANQSLARQIITPTVIVAALGYFVDIYDLIIFGVVRDASLADLGYGGDKMAGSWLLNMQMAGMLLGGIIWGILGDRRGRLSVLFGSIIMYSLANIANGLVNDLNMYGLLRFVAGIGLAGELGAGITLVSESLPTNRRGIGTMVVVVVGALGAVAAATVGNIFDNWRVAYFIGGGMGLLLLLLRMGTYESRMFRRMEETDVPRGAFLSLFANGKRLVKYLACIAVGLPVWFVVGILIINVAEYASVIGPTGPIVTGDAIMFTYLGLSFGDLMSGLLSQALQSRRKTVYIYLAMNVVLTLVFLFMRGVSPTFFYGMCFMLGIATGYWAIFVTIATEQFGTNLRATVTTTVPNFVRGAVVPMTLAFRFIEGESGLVSAGLIIGGVSLALATISVYHLRETFHKDLNYTETL